MGALMIPGFWRRCVLLVPLVSLPACAAKSQFAEVTGVVKLDGEPMPDALVEFLPDPDRGTSGPRSFGLTDAQGRFRLTCEGERDGAVVGFHRVLVQDVRTFPPQRNRQAVGPPPVMPRSRVSSRYENASATPLRQEVGAEPQFIVVEVKSK
jgi:hypothetical protein